MSVEVKAVRHGGNELEVACVSASRAVLREVQQIFPSKSLSEVRVVATCQRSAMELVNWGDDVATEKDRLLEAFAAFAAEVCEALAAKGFWADFIDPCSGLPSISKESAAVYDEVAGAQAVLKYDVFDAGPCKILRHPTWGSAVYPATIFTDAPKADADAVIATYLISSESSTSQ